MKKRSEKKSKKGNNKIVLVILILIMCALGVCLMIRMGPYYKIESRVSNIEQYNTGREDEVEARSWIRIQGTDIDYPIIIGNMSYMTVKDVDGNFAWELGSYKDLPNRLVVFGHNVKNLSANPIITDKEHGRFEQLPSFLYLDFVKKNKYIQITNDGKDYLYKIFSVAIAEDNDLEYESGEYSTNEIKEYITKAKENSIYDFDVGVNENDKIVSLVTCTRIYGATRDYDLVIDARLVRDGESINNYNVEASDNYKKIEDAMRGDIDEKEA